MEVSTEKQSYTQKEVQTIRIKGVLLGALIMFLIIRLSSGKGLF